MACKKCGSDWVTLLGSDCESCPHCCKQQRCKAKKEGRWVQPTAQKVCEECASEFTAVGLQEIGVRVLCRNPQCKKSRDKKARDAAHVRRAAGVFVLPRTHKEKRCCKFSKCGKELTRRDQKEYCGRACYFAAIDAGEQQFKGRVRDAWAALTGWFSGNSWRKPTEHGRHPTYRPRPPCEVCGAEVNHRRSKCCSYRCKKLWRGPRKCVCGTVIENARLFGRAHCRECKLKSKRIHRRMYGSYRRRCRTYGGHFNKDVRPQRVFERDGWVCHLCNRKTHKVFSNKDPLSATVDHYPVPLSEGGDHDWHNVRTACFRCNSLQGNRTGYTLDADGRVVAATG